MIGLDTNVVVRYVVHDDVAQTARSSAVIESLTPEEPGFVSLPAILEIVWVLESAYAFDRGEIAGCLESLLRSREIVVERADLVLESVGRYKKGRAEFADCLIERCGSAVGCLHTLTFHRQAANTAGMKLLK